MPTDNPTTIDEYIAGYRSHIQTMMNDLRRTIHNAVPTVEVEEKISWKMATFVYLGNLVHFAGEKHHIGFHPGASGVEAFQSELDGFKWSKGTIQFPYDKPIPFDLVDRIVRFRVDEQKKLYDEKQAAKKSAKRREDAIK